MVRLNPTNINKPELSYKIFKERWRGNLHYIDWNRFATLIKKYKGGKYLDIGCFNSPMPYELKIDSRYKHEEVVAIDYCDELIKDLKSNYPEVQYSVMDANKMTFLNDYFDYVVAGELLEHMEKPEDTVKEMMRVIKPGGTLALSVPLNELERGNVSDEHLWSFASTDIINMLSKYGEVEINYYMDTVPLIIAYCKKK